MRLLECAKRNPGKSAKFINLVLLIFKYMMTHAWRILITYIYFKKDLIHNAGYFGSS